ncbi:MAG TPA: hypothetical protein VHP14_04080, partial [Anaerolineales bacterium]|nr:hypothetical protein [Anaerolineales bacterium]
SPASRFRSTGIRTEIGKIGTALQILEPENTNLQHQTGKIVRNFAAIGLAMCVVVVVCWEYGVWVIPVFGRRA